MDNIFVDYLRQALKLPTPVLGHCRMSNYRRPPNRVPTANSILDNHKLFVNKTLQLLHLPLGWQMTAKHSHDTQNINRFSFLPGDKRPWRAIIPRYLLRIEILVNNINGYSFGFTWHSRLTILRQLILIIYHLPENSKIWIWISGAVWERMGTSLRDKLNDLMCNLKKCSSHGKYMLRVCSKRF